MRTVKLDEIVRQRDPELKRVVEQLAQGQVGEAIGSLERQGRVHEVKDHEKRIAAITSEYVRSPENTLVVSPDNRSRAELNTKIHDALQKKGVVSREEYRVQTLAPRQDLTGADRTWAARYNVNDVLLCARTSKETGIAKGEYARVKSVDAESNLLTVARLDKAGQLEEHTYDPRRQQGVSIYREQERAFSVGDRIQFTAPANEVRIANRELGTVQAITDDGRLSLRMDGGRTLSIDPREHPHLDYGYAVTSHSSQSQTADRVLIHVDTELAAKDLLNNRMAYVAVSRGAHDAQIFTSDRQQLPEALNRDVSHQSAHAQEVRQEPTRAVQQELLTGRELIDQPLRRWTPLNEALPAEEARQFAWKQESGTIQSYQHMQTERHIHAGTAGRYHRACRKLMKIRESISQQNAHSWPGFVPD